MWKLISAVLLTELWVCHLLPNTSNDALKLNSQNNSLYFRDLVRYSKGAEMRNYLDASVEPCRNFYRHVCGNWAKINPTSLRNGLHAVTWDLLEQMYERKIQNVLNKGIDAADTPSDKTILNFYDSCTMMRHQLTERQRAKLRTVIDEFSSMPAIMGDQWAEKSFDWVQIVADIWLKYGLNIVLGSSIRPDIAVNSDGVRVHRAFIDVPNFPNFGANFNKRQIRNVLEQILNSNKAAIDDLVAELFQFETALAADLKATVEPKPYSVEQLHQKYMHVVDIKKYLNTTLGDEVFTEIVYDSADIYMRKLAALLPKTPKKLLANYIFYKLIADFYIKNVHTDEGQGKMCAEKTRQYFAKNLDSMIFRIYNGERTESDVLLIWREMKSVFRTKLRSKGMDWMDASARNHALEKLNTMQLEISTYANDEFNTQVGEIDINRMDFIGNIQHIKVLKHRTYADKWGQPVRPTDGAEDNFKLPKYFPRENVIKVPVSFLQPHILWDAQYPYALKFATLGSIIGNALLHGFDDSGRQHDKDGQISNWWDETTLHNYYKRAECFHTQLEKYASSKGNDKRAKKTIAKSELVADSAGLAVAYTAYLQWYENISNRNDSLTADLEVLPNVRYNNRQLFFTSFAQMRCENEQTLTRLFHNGNYEQSAEFRVNEALSNLVDFSNAFLCDNGTQMNPIEKCQIY